MRSLRAPLELLSFPTRRSSDLPRRHRGCARRRGGEPLEGAVFLAARQEQPVGRGRSAARVLEPVQELGRLIAHVRSEEHTSELQSRVDLVCRLLLEKKKGQNQC